MSIGFVSDIQHEDGRNGPNQVIAEVFKNAKSLWSGALRLGKN